MHIYLQGSHVLENTFLCVHKKQYQLFHIGLKTITAEPDSYNLLDSRGCCHRSRPQPNLTVRQQGVLSRQQITAEPDCLTAEGVVTQ